MGFEEIWMKKIQEEGSSADTWCRESSSVEKLRKEMELGASLDAKYFCFVSRRRLS